MRLEDIKWTHVVFVFVVVAGTMYISEGNLSGLTNIDSEYGTTAKIDIDGPVMSSQGVARDVTSPSTVRDLVHDAQSDGVDAYLFEINSPGGAVVPSRDVQRIIEDIDEPTACMMKDFGASGAYLIATACDHIIADSLTLTGSIGARRSYLEFSGLLNKMGIEYVNISAGKFKETGSPFMNATGQDRQMMADRTERVHDVFIQIVQENRNLSSEELAPYTEGQVLLGEEAQQAGLIDQLGSRDEAVTYLENRTDKKLSVKTYQKKEPFNILSLLLTQVGKGISQGLLEAERRQGQLQIER
jgi:protease-4